MSGKPTYEELENKIRTLESKFCALQDHTTNTLTDERYKAIVETAVDAIVFVNDRAEITEWPSQAELLCGWSSNEMIGKPIYSIMPSRYRKMHSTLLKDVIIGKRGEHFGKRIEASILDRFDREVPVELAVALTKIGNRSEMTLFMHDITERKKNQEILHEISVTDVLTGLFNRRGFLALAGKQLQTACRQEVDIFLLYADFDNMKGINDILGHKIGDLALVDTAGLLQDTFRQADLIGRVGGDEFLVLLSDNKGNSSEETVVSRLEENIRLYNQRPDIQYKILLSIGTVRYNPEEPCSIEELMSKADAMMYKSKKGKKQAGAPGYTKK